MIHPSSTGVLALAMLLAFVGEVPHTAVAAGTSKKAAPAKPAKERNLDAAFETTLSVAPGQLIPPTGAITMWLPKGVRAAGEKMPACDPVRLVADGPEGCPSRSRAGGGAGTALIIRGGVGAGNEPLSLVLFNGPGNSLLGLARGSAPIPINAVVRTTVAKAAGGAHGYGQVMRFAFPPELTHPQADVTASIVSLSARLSGRAGWLRSRSCPRKGWSFGALLTSVDGGETSIMADLACV